MSADAVDSCSDYQKRSNMTPKPHFRSGSVVDRLLTRRKNTDPRLEKPLSRDVVIDEIYSFNLAAIFNFGMTMSVTLHYILSEKTIYDRLRSDILQLVSDPIETIEPSEILKLPYLVIIWLLSRKSIANENSPHVSMKGFAWGMVRSAGCLVLYRHQARSFMAMCYQLV